MKSQSLIALACGLLLSGAALACADCAEHAKADAKPAASEEAAQGMIAVRDPVTGQLRAPTADELATMQAKSQAAQAAKSPRMRALAVAPSQPVRMHASGARGLRMTDEQASYSVVTRNADGSLSSTCVQGKEQAEATVLNNAAKSGNKE